MSCYVQSYVHFSIIWNSCKRDTNKSSPPLTQDINQTTLPSWNPSSKVTYTNKESEQKKVTESLIRQRLHIIALTQSRTSKILVLVMRFRQSRSLYSCGIGPSRSWTPRVEFRLYILCTHPRAERWTIGDRVGRRCGRQLRHLYIIRCWCEILWRRPRAKAYFFRKSRASHYTYILSNFDINGCLC